MYAFQVTIGNIRKMAGYVQYEDGIDGAMVIVVSAVTVVFLIFVIFLGKCMYATLNLSFVKMSVELNY